MQRYSVTIVSPGTPSKLPVLAVPFEPSALIAGFIQEIFKRLARLNIALAANTHICTLHLDSETGAIVDCEDVIADVVFPGDALFAVFSPVAAQSTAEQPTSLAIRSSPAGGDMLSVRVITAARTKSDKSALQILSMPASTTIKELHEKVSSLFNLDNPD